MISKHLFFSSIVEDDTAGSMASLMPPKHAHVPEVPVDGNLIFEGIMFVFSVMCLCLQYINLYKTVWWLPHSHSNYALVKKLLANPHLINLQVLDAFHYLEIGMINVILI